MSLHFFGERKAHAPLPAVAHVDNGVRVVIAEDHRNRAAGSGCHVAACSPVFLDVARRIEAPIMPTIIAGIKPTIPIQNSGLTM